jgi:hypothetical protein
VIAARAQLVLFAACLTAALVIGCSSESSAGSDADAGPSCDRTLPTCPTTPPSYAQTIAPIFHDVCAGCHYAGSTTAREVFDTYAEVSGDRGSILDQVYSCRMPQAPVILTEEQRTALLTWLVCNAPNN